MLDRTEHVSGPDGDASGESFTAFEVIEGPADAGLLLICDHASNALPPGYGTLGLPPEQLERHIGYDIGAAAVTRRLAERLGVPAVLSTFSRLLIDPNRGLDDPTLVMRLSDGAVVPGNARIDRAEIEHRIAAYHAPYHDALTATIDRAVDAGKPPVLASIHSFTPAWKGAPRRWHAGVLWDRDPRFAIPFIEELEKEKGLVVGDNEPYRGSLSGDCMYRHGTQRGLAHGLLEIRQDLIAEENGVAEWVDRLARIIPAAMTRDGLHDIIHYGSHSDD